MLNLGLFQKLKNTIYKVLPYNYLLIFEMLLQIAFNVFLIIVDSTLFSYYSINIQTHNHSISAPYFIRG